MRPIKIQITPAMREFNEQVEHADFLLDYQFDQETALTLLERLKQARCYPNSCESLEAAITKLAITHPVCDCGKQGFWHGDRIGHRMF